MTAKLYLRKTKATPNIPTVFSVKASQNSVGFEGQMASLMFTVMTTCSREFVSLALQGLFAWITTPAEWIKAFAIWSQLETYFWSQFPLFIKHRFFILSCFVFSSNDLRSLGWLRLHSKSLPTRRDVHFRVLNSFWTRVWNRDILFVWEEKDNCCLPGYQLISSLLTSGRLAKFTPLPSNLLNNYQTIQAAPIVFYNKALITWYI